MYFNLLNAYSQFYDPEIECETDRRPAAKRGIGMFATHTFQAGDGECLVSRGNAPFALSIGPGRKGGRPTRKAYSLATCAV